MGRLVARAAELELAMEEGLMVEVVEGLAEVGRPAERLVVGTDRGRHMRPSRR